MAAGAVEAMPLASALDALTADDATRLHETLLSLRETLVGGGHLDVPGGHGSAPYRDRLIAAHSQGVVLRRA